MIPEIWTICSGNAGMKSALMGLAEAINTLPIRHKIVKRKRPWVWLPQGIAWRALHQVTHDSDSIVPPYPRILLSCGRRAVPFALAIKKASPGTLCIQVQNPGIRLDRFDLVVAPEHDGLSGPNVITSTWAIHHITPMRLLKAADNFRETFARFPHPRVALILGGNTNRYRFTETTSQQIIKTVTELLGIQASVWIIPSSRTPDDLIYQLHNHFHAVPQVFLYTPGAPDNPYQGALALADTILVTNDSSNMMSEAASTSKPLYLIPLAGHQDTPPARLGDKLIQHGIARLWQGILETWHYKPPAEVHEIAARIRQHPLVQDLFA